MSTPNSSDGGGGMLPFRVSTDFNLGLFLKNEKSALKLDRTASGRLKSWPSSASSTCNRFAQVDDYVTREYWSLDIEYLCRFSFSIFENDLLFSHHINNSSTQAPPHPQAPSPSSSSQSLHLHLHLDHHHHHHHLNYSVRHLTIVKHIYFVTSL